MQEARNAIIENQKKRRKKGGVQGCHVYAHNLDEKGLDPVKGIEG